MTFAKVMIPRMAKRSATLCNPSCNPYCDEYNYFTEKVAEKTKKIKFLLEILLCRRSGWLIDCHLILND
jgi:hypothetical protein